MSNKNGSKWIRPEKRQAIYARDGWRCLFCGQTLETLTLDHLRPRELGGSNHEKNLVTACFSCNNAKKNLPIRVFIENLRKQGKDTEEIRKRIRRHTRRKLKGYYKKFEKH